VEDSRLASPSVMLCVRVEVRLFTQSTKGCLQRMIRKLRFSIECASGVSGLGRSRCYGQGLPYRPIVDGSFS
jgi:hypothetical protein